MAKKGGAAKPVKVETAGRRGPAYPVFGVQTLGKLQGGAKQRVYIVDDDYIAQHGLVAGEPLPVYELASRGEIGGPAIPVYVVGGSLAPTPPACIPGGPLASIADSSANALVGTCTDIVAACDDGILLNGTSSYVQLPAANIDAAGFNGSSIGIIARAKVSGAGVWADGQDRQILTIGANNNNRFRIWKTPHPRITWDIRASGGTAQSMNKVYGPPSFSDFFGVGLVCTAGGDGKAFLNGAQNGTTQSGMGTFVGALANTHSLFGSLTQTPTILWDGWLKDLVIALNITPSDANMNWLTDPANTITATELNSRIGAGSWLWWPCNESS